MRPRTYGYIFAILTSANFAVAQSSLPLPACANACLNGIGSGGGTVGGCSSLDVACICANKDLLSTSACCLHEKCSDADRETTEEYTRSVCKAVGVAIPSLVACSTVVSSATGGSPTGSSTSKTSNDDSSQTTISTSDSDNQGSGSGSSGSSGSHNTPVKKKKKSTSGLGIGLGVGIPVLAIIVGAVFLYLRRSKKKQANNPPPMPVQQAYMPPQGQPPANYTYPNNGYPPVQELPTPTPAIYEKDGVVMTGSSPANPAELTSDYRPHNELAGSTPQPAHELPQHPYGQKNQSR